MLGWRVETPPMPRDRGQVEMWKLAAFHLKELFALPYDAALLMLRDMRGHKTFVVNKRC